MKPAMGLCALLCACTPKPSEAPKPAPSAAAAMPAPQPALQGAVSAALARQEHPAAAAVLSLPGPRVLALGGQGGTDAARSALRPGSTVKPLLAYAAARMMLSPDYHVTCDGTYGAFHCFAKHGELGLSDALEASCNTYFYEVSEHMGLDRVRSGFSAFGLGQPTGLAPGEVAGQLPSDDQLKRVSAKQSVWPLLVGIGHGPLAVTPLQLANAYAALVDKLAQHPGEGSVYDQYPRRTAPSRCRRAGYGPRRGRGRASHRREDRHRPGGFRTNPKTRNRCPAGSSDTRRRTRRRWSSPWSWRAAGPVARAPRPLPTTYSPPGKRLAEPSTLDCWSGADRQ